MARTMTGTGRVTVLALLHTWPDRYAVLAYTTTGHVGDTAVIGHVPTPAAPDLSLMGTAARHQPARVYGSGGGAGFAEACWLICVGWSGRSLPKPGGLELYGAAWALELSATTELGRNMYGHDRLHVGRFSFGDDLLARRARGVCPWGQGVEQPS
ncbi:MULTISPECIES: hypothetical protein [unclassified Streptomyces]|uniref:hypothetical protein n=1 Tax=unclassified Streptomyces TaxID=2593676 RepID=UPI0037F5DAC3